MATPIPLHAATAEPAPVAQYVRASTDRQCYSTEGQSEANSRYAAEHGMSIVRTYADDGRSGLSLRGRPGLMQLLEDIQRGDSRFKAVLVYDVSRWGRFQDIDESAFYEYLCRRSGIRVVYCAEPFGDVEGPLSALIKTLKRTMAGEFSRELSKKVFAGQARLAERGYRQGGVPGFGLRRLLIDGRGEPKGLLKKGERKSLQSDRVVLVPGPDEEVAVVHRIYKLYVNDGISERGISQALNAEGLVTGQGKPWCRASVKQVLTNPKYAGVNVYNRASFKLRAARARNPQELWVRHPNAFAPIVPQERFEAAQQVRAAKAIRLGAEGILDELRGLLERYGRLNTDLIDGAGLPFKRRVVAARFGSLPAAYERVGFASSAKMDLLDQMRRHNIETHVLLSDLIARIRAHGVGVRRNGASLQFDLSTGLSVRLVVLRPSSPRGERDSWRRKCACTPPDLFVVYRLACEHGNEMEQFLFPREHMPGRPRELDCPAAQTFRLGCFVELVAMACCGKPPT
jgi:DNA invertase Pin-like site-specific DNA recombinase